MGQFPGLLLGMEDMHMEKRVLRWRGVHWQPAEPINVGLGLPWTMMDGEVVLLQCCRPAMKERGPCPHRLEPLERIVVGEDLEWYGHEVWPELWYRPHDS